MNPSDKSILLEFKKNVPPNVRGHLKKIILFGSRARGDAKDDSDLDLIALVDKESPQIEKSLEDIAYQVMWDHDFRPIISLKVFSENQFNGAVRQGFSFYCRIAKEGIPL